MCGGSFTEGKGHVLYFMRRLQPEHHRWAVVKIRLFCVAPFFLQPTPILNAKSEGRSCCCYGYLWALLFFFKFQTISVRRTIAHVGFLRPWSISLGPSHSEKKKKKSCSTSNNHRVLPCARSSQRCHWSADLLTLLLYDMHMFGVYFLYDSSFVSEQVVVCI